MLLGCCSDEESTKREGRGEASKGAFCCVFANWSEPFEMVLLLLRVGRRGMARGGEGGLGSRGDEEWRWREGSGARLVDVHGDKFSGECRCEVGILSIALANRYGVVAVCRDNSNVVCVSC